MPADVGSCIAAGTYLDSRAMRMEVAGCSELEKLARVQRKFVQRKFSARKACQGTEKFACLVSLSVTCPLSSSSKDYLASVCL